VLIALCILAVAGFLLWKRLIGDAMVVLCVAILVALIAGCTTPPKQFSYGTCKVSVMRVDALGVSHEDCVYQTIP
jgi:uncharacterized membrane protein affecting hemolysin expression